MHARALKSLFFFLAVVLILVAVAVYFFLNNNINAGLFFAGLATFIALIGIYFAIAPEYQYMDLTANDL